MKKEIKEKKKNSKVGTFALGALVGVGAGLLFAPKSGKELRADLKVKFTNLKDKVKNLEMEDIKKSINDKIDEIQEDIKNFDKEKALSKAKEKAKEIEAKAQELVDEAVKTAKPALEELAKDVKKQTVKALKATITALEKENSSK